MVNDYKFVKIAKATDKKKKLSAIFRNVNTGKLKIINFRAVGYDDFLTHKDEERKRNYIARHASREDWSNSGIMTSGFWARHLL